MLNPDTGSTSLHDNDSKIRFDIEHWAEDEFYFILINEPGFEKIRLNNARLFLPVSNFLTKNLLRWDLVKNPLNRRIQNLIPQH